ncbi:MAG: hypothetical protein K6E87_04295 [bacterium]|nr:hypothetical protein [bacterium]
MTEKEKKDLERITKPIVDDSNSARFTTYCPRTKEDNETKPNRKEKK